MTAAALPPSVSYTENAVTLSHPVPFRFFPSTLEVTRFLPSGGFVVLIENVDYTVTGGETDAGGALIKSVAGVVGATLRINRVTPRSQQVDYRTNDTFPAETHEDAIDRAMLIDQEQDVKIGSLLDRAILLPDGEQGAVLPERAARLGGNKVLGPNSLTGEIELLTPSDFRGDPGADMSQVGTLEQAVAMNILANAPATTRITVTDRGFFDKYVGPALPATQEGFSWFKDADNTIWRVAGPSLMNGRAHGVHGDGSADCMIAISKLPPGHYFVEGLLRAKTAQAWPSGVQLIGNGHTSDPRFPPTPACTLEKDFDGPIKLGGDHCGLHNLHVTRVVGRTGDLVQVTGSRVECGLFGGLSFSDAERDGLRVGTDGPPAEPYVNANYFRAGRLIFRDMGRNAVRFLQQGGADIGTSSWPVGLADVNACHIGQIIGAECAGDVVHLGNSIDGMIDYIGAEGNTGYGLHLAPYVTGWTIGKIYSEANVAGDLFVDATASRNNINLWRSPMLKPVIVNSSPRGANKIAYWSSDVGASADTNDPRAGGWVDGEEHNLADDRIDGQVSWGGYLGPGAATGRMRLERDGASGTRLVFSTKRNGATELDHLDIDQGGLVRLLNSNAMLFGKSVIDTTSPGLTVYGTLAPRIDFVVAGVGVVPLTSHYNGNGFVGGISLSGANTIYGITSDVRMKDNVRPLDAALYLLRQLKPKTYEMKSDGSTQVGFLAHELQSIMPYAVIGQPDEKRRTGRLFDADGHCQSDNCVEPQALEKGWTFEPTGVVDWYQQVDLSKLVPLLTASLIEVDYYLKSKFDDYNQGD